MAKRLRAVLQRPDGSILLLEDGKDNPSAKLLQLAPKPR
jgi:hypothetical protein